MPKTLGTLDSKPAAIPSIKEAESTLSISDLLSGKSRASDSAKAFLSSPITQSAMKITGKSASKFLKALSHQVDEIKPNQLMADPRTALSQALKSAASVFALDLAVNENTLPALLSKIKSLMPDLEQQLPPESIAEIKKWIKDAELGKFIERKPIQSSDSDGSTDQKGKAKASESKPAMSQPTMSQPTMDTHLARLEQRAPIEYLNALSGLLKIPLGQPDMSFVENNGQKLDSLFEDNGSQYYCHKSVLNEVLLLLKRVLRRASGENVIEKPITVLSGEPGTGKTTTLTKTAAACGIPCIIVKASKLNECLIMNKNESDPSKKDPVILLEKMICEGFLNNPVPHGVIVIDDLNEAFEAQGIFASNRSFQVKLLELFKRLSSPTQRKEIFSRYDFGYGSPIDLGIADFELVITTNVPLADLFSKGLDLSVISKIKSIHESPDLSDRQRIGHYFFEAITQNSAIKNSQEALTILKSTIDKIIQKDWKIVADRFHGQLGIRGLIRLLDEVHIILKKSNGDLDKAILDLQKFSSDQLDAYGEDPIDHMIGLIMDYKKSMNSSFKKTNEQNILKAAIAELENKIDKTNLPTNLKLALKVNASKLEELDFNEALQIKEQIMHLTSLLEQLDPLSEDRGREITDKIAETFAQYRTDDNKVPWNAIREIVRNLDISRRNLRKGKISDSPIIRISSGTGLGHLEIIQGISHAFFKRSPVFINLRTFLERSSLRKWGFEIDDPQSDIVLENRASYLYVNSNTVSGEFTFSSFLDRKYAYLKTNSPTKLYALNPKKLEPYSESSPTILKIDKDSIDEIYDDLPTFRSKFYDEMFSQMVQYLTEMIQSTHILESHIIINIDDQMLGILREFYQTANKIDPFTQISDEKLIKDFEKRLYNAVHSPISNHGYTFDGLRFFVALPEKLGKLPLEISTTISLNVESLGNRREFFEKELAKYYSENVPWSDIFSGKPIERTLWENLLAYTDKTFEKDANRDISAEVFKQAIEIYRFVYVEAIRNHKSVDSDEVLIKDFRDDISDLYNKIEKGPNALAKDPPVSTIPQIEKDSL